MVDGLRRIAEAERDAGRSLVGLAANQVRWRGPIGSIALMDLGTQEPDTGLSDLTVVIDPVFILDALVDVDEKPEGCFSCAEFSALLNVQSGASLEVMISAHAI